MLGQIFEKIEENFSKEAICDFIETQMYAAEILEDAMKIQNEELKENGYQ
jgi:hypothetical protein